MLYDKRLCVQRDGYIGADGGEEARETDILCLLLYVFLLCAFQLVGVLEQGVDVAEPLEQGNGGFLTDAFTSRDVVACVAHQSQKVNHLALVLESVLGADLLRSHLLKSAHMTRTIDEDMFVYQLPVVFVGRCHIDLEACGLSLLCQGAYHVVCFKA